MQQVIIDFLVELLKFLAASGIFAILFRSFLKFRKVKNKKAIEQGFINSAKIAELLANFRYTAKASRVMLVASHNGNGLPEPGKPLKLSVIHEAVDDQAKAVKSELQDVLLDEPYLYVLYRLITSDDGYITVKDEEMERGVFFRLNEYLNVHDTFMIKVGPHSKNFYFVVVQWAEDRKRQSGFDKDFTLRFDILRSKISKLMDVEVEKPWWQF